MRRIKLAFFHLPSWLFRWFKRITVMLAVLCVIAAGAWQFWLVPRLNDYRPMIVEQLQKATGVHVSIGSVTGGWRLFHPSVTLSQFAMGNTQAKSDLVFHELEASLSVWHLLIGEFRFKQIRLQSPLLEISRASDGTWFIGGVRLSHQTSKDHRLFDWFLSQGEIVIDQGALRFRDQKKQYPDLDLTDLDFFTDQFFSTHRFELAFTPPANVGPRIKMQGRFEGRNVLELQQGSGWFKAQVPQTNLVKLMPWFSSFVPNYELKQGYGQVDLRLEFAKSRLAAFDAQLKVKDWLIAAKQNSDMYSLPVFDAAVFWTDTPSGKTLKLDGRRIESSRGTVCDSCTLNYTQAKSGSSLTLKKLQLSGLNAYLPHLKKLENALGAQIGQGEFSGLIQQANLNWQGTWQAPKLLQSDVDLQAFKVIHPELSLGPINLSAQIKEQGGRIDLEGQNVLFGLPAQFVDPIVFNEAHTRLEWAKKAQQWQFDVVDLSLMNPALQLKVKANYEGPSSGLGKIKLSGDINHLSANQVYRYLPRILGDDVLAWLQHALQEGRASDGKIIWQGDVAGFPYAKGTKDESRGRFAIEAKAQDVKLDYVEGWPWIEKIQGSLAFEGLSMLVKASSGEISNTQLSDVVVQIPNLETDQHVLVDGKVSGKTSDFLHFVANSPVKESTDGFLDNLTAQGSGNLALKLDLPINDIDATKVAGHYDFKQNQLHFGGGIPVLNAANGRVEFTESKLKIPNADALALGGRVKMLGVNDEHGGLVLTLTGDAAMPDVASAYLPALQKKISGQIKYQAKLTIEPKAFDLALKTDLQGAQIDLPAPLAKSSATQLPFSIHADGNAQQVQLAWKLGDLISGKVNSVHAEAAAGLQIGINLGSDAAALPNQGVLLTGAWPSLDVDTWLELSQSLSKGEASDLPPIQVKNLKFDQLTAWGRVLHSVKLNAKSEVPLWLLELDSKELKGKLEWNGAKPSVKAQLAKLWLPFETSQTQTTSDSSNAVQNSAFDTPSAWPFVNLEVADLRFNDVQFGQLQVVAKPQAQALAIEQLQLKNSDGVFELAGEWTQRGGKNITAGKVDLTSPSAGRLLARLGYPEAMKQAPIHFSGDAHWQGVPWAPQLNSLQGKFNIDVGAGRFVQVDPGVGRFLTVINLQAIPRRLKLDFDDVISQGFAFDRITGDAQMVSGVATTKNLIIDAPAAKVRFQGDANFVAGTQKIVVKIIPSVADTVALGVAVINPIAGLATFAAQRLFDQDVVGQLVSFEYLIDGTMRDPQVKKLK